MGARNRPREIGMGLPSTSRNDANAGAILNEARRGGATLQEKKRLHHLGWTVRAPRIL